MEEKNAKERGDRCEPAVNEPSKAKKNAVPTRLAVTKEETFNFLRMLKKIECNRAIE